MKQLKAISSQRGRKGLIAVMVTIIAILLNPTIANAAEISSVASGSDLTSGQSLISPNGQYSAKMQSDGNFVVYLGTTVRFATGTSGNPGSHLAIQSDGNVVVYSSPNAPLWNSQTSGFASKTSLKMQDDGNLVLYNEGQVPLWSTQGGQTGAHQDSLRPGRDLQSEQFLASMNNRYHAKLQANGKLVILEGATVAYSTPSGATKGAPRLSVQGDSNVVIYGGDNAVLWTANTAGYTSSPVLTMQNDGLLSLTTSDGIPIWTSKGGLVAQVAINSATKADILHRNVQSLQSGSAQIAQYPQPTSLQTSARASAVAAQDAKLETQRDLYVRANEKFANVSTDASVGAISIVGAEATAKVTETTALTRAGIASESPQAINSYILEQDVRLVYSGGIWKVDRLTNPPIANYRIPVTILPSAAAQAAQASGSTAALIDKVNAGRLYAQAPDALSIPQIETASRQADAQKLEVSRESGASDNLTRTPDEVEKSSQDESASSYAPNRANAVKYALDHAVNRAPWWEYKSLDDDCTNYISQVLSAGGWPKEYGNPLDSKYGDTSDEHVWYGGPIVNTDTWGKAQNLFDYGFHTTGRFHYVSNSAKPAVGDITFWIWSNDEDGLNYVFDHVSMVTAVDSTGMPYYSYHTSDNKNKSLAAILSQDPGAIYSAWAW